MNDNPKWVFRKGDRLYIIQQSNMTPTMFNVWDENGKQLGLTLFENLSKLIKS